MAKTIYVKYYCLDVDYVTADLSIIEKDCKKWVADHHTDYHVERDFNRWVEGRPYPHTDAGENEAWEDYAEHLFENGTWGDYSWDEVCLK